MSSVSWCVRKSGILVDSSFDRWVNNLLGNLNVLPGILALGIPVAGFIYLKTAPLWVLWLALKLRKRGAAGVAAVAPAVSAANPR